MSAGRLHIAFDPIYAHPLPEGHRFPMLKYELIPGQLLHEGCIRHDHLVSPQTCPDEVVLLAHDDDYVQRLQNLELSAKEQREIGFPQSAALMEREWRIAQGTIDCALAARQSGVALNVAGGTHHAFRHRGEGFCLLNDIAIGAMYLLEAGLSKQVLVIDLDVHQGNGTAAICKDLKQVFTFSMHGAHNYPFRKEQSDLDIGLADGSNDEMYLSVLSHTLEGLLEQVKPDFVFYQAGVDILGTDRYGKLNISMAGCAQRDRIVFESLHNRSIPCAVSMGGGYSRDVRHIVEAHCQTFRLAKEIWMLD